MKKNILWLVAVLGVVFSCRTKPAEQSDLNYLQNIEKVAVEASLNMAHTTLQPGDQLVILISGRDQDVVRPFNQNYSSGELIQNSTAGGNTPSAGQTAFSGPTYIIDSEGNIDFPNLGKIPMSGKTVEEAKQDVAARLRRYIISPIVSLRISNYKVTVLGEVNRPGQYIIPDGQTTLLNAIGLAGDLTMYGKRNDVLIVRNYDGQMTKQRVDLTDASFIGSPYYYLKQGDVIYVSASRNREIAARQNPNTGLYVSMASVALGLIGLLVSILKK